MKLPHPFPARMAPEVIEAILSTTPKSSLVLDPMCGSGSVPFKAAQLGIKAIGVDSDPLAVLMTKVATQGGDGDAATQSAERVLSYASRYGIRKPFLDSIASCPETKQFSKYWFGRKQLRELNAIAHGIHKESKCASENSSNILRLALSRTIISKTVGASLAIDVSHSRPHRVMIKNEYDTFDGFARSVKSIVSFVKQANLEKKARICEGDARKLKGIRTGTVDAIITSPPYLNAIDYLRGHKLSLIWLGYGIPQLRSLRSQSIGTERGMCDEKIEIRQIWEEIVGHCPQICELSPRHQAIVRRYVDDVEAMQREFGRVVKRGAVQHVVIGDSHIRGVFVPNSTIIEICAKKAGFVLQNKTTREIPDSKRYLPRHCTTGMLAKRMRQEIVQSFTYEG